MRCPRCGRNINMLRSDVDCAVCGWEPPPAAAEVLKFIPPLKVHAAGLASFLAATVFGYFVLDAGVIWPLAALASFSTIPIAVSLRKRAVLDLVGTGQQE